jgi:hypothetical protein
MEKNIFGWVYTNSKYTTKATVNKMLLYIFWNKIYMPFEKQQWELFTQDGTNTQKSWVWLMDYIPVLEQFFLPLLVSRKTF